LEEGAGWLIGSILPRRRLSIKRSVRPRCSLIIHRALLQCDTLRLRARRYRQIGPGEELLVFKVALVGTHGVNKTTIAYELAGTLKRKAVTVELLTEIARECPFPLNESATRQAYQWIIARQIQMEIEKAPRADVLVCDRSVLDNFAYYIRRYHDVSEESAALGAYCRSWMTSYDLLVRCTVTRALESDGFRSTDTRFQSEIDKLCDELFESVYDQTTHPAYVRGPLSAIEIAEIILRSWAIKADGVISK